MSTLQSCLNDLFQERYFDSTRVWYDVLTCLFKEIHFDLKQSNITNARLNDTSSKLCIYIQNKVSDVNSPSVKKCINLNELPWIEFNRWNCLGLSKRLVEIISRNGLNAFVVPAMDDFGICDHALVANVTEDSQVTLMDPGYVIPHPFTLPLPSSSSFSIPSAPEFLNAGSLCFSYTNKNMVKMKILEGKEEIGNETINLQPITREQEIEIVMNVLSTVYPDTELQKLQLDLGEENNDSDASQYFLPLEIFLPPSFQAEVRVEYVQIYIDGNDDSNAKADKHNEIHSIQVFTTQNIDGNPVRVCLDRNEQDKLAERLAMKNLVEDNLFRVIHSGIKLIPVIRQFALNFINSRLVSV